MARTKQYAVKVTVNQRKTDTTLLECLRYAQIISAPEDFEDLDTSFKIYCPKCMNNPKLWAEMNAERMRTFGYKTEVVELK